MPPYHLKPIRRRLRLGRGGVVYLVATGLILGAALYTQANLLFWAFGLMVGGLVASILVALVSLRRVSIRRLTPDHAVVGDPLVLRYHITHHGRIPAFGVLVYETWGTRRRAWKKIGPVADEQLTARPTGWLMHLGPGQTLQAEAIAWPRRRGVLAFESIIIESGFPFGILRKVLVFHTRCEMIVYPRLHRIHRRLILSIARADTCGTRQIDRGGGGEEFFGLRAYRPGDSVKLIDWKHSARGGQLVIREMTRPSLPRIVVLLDLRARSGETIDAPGCERAISLAGSLLCDAYLCGYQIGLEIAGAATGTDRFPAHHSLPHRTRILETLARLDTDRLRPTDPVADRPTVIVRPGRGDPIESHRTTLGLVRPLVLGGDDLQTYVQNPTAHDRLLTRRASPPSARQLRREARMLRAHRAGASNGPEDPGKFPGRSGGSEGSEGSVG